MRRTYRLHKKLSLCHKRPRVHIVHEVARWREVPHGVYLRKGQEYYVRTYHHDISIASSSGAEYKDEEGRMEWRGERNEVIFFPLSFHCTSSSRGLSFSPFLPHSIQLLFHFPPSPQGPRWWRRRPAGRAKVEFAIFWSLLPLKSVSKSLFAFSTNKKSTPSPKNNGSRSAEKQTQTLNCRIFLSAHQTGKQEFFQGGRPPPTAEDRRDCSVFSETGKKYEGGHFSPFFFPHLPPPPPPLPRKEEKKRKTLFRERPSVLGQDRRRPPPYASQGRAGEKLFAAACQ